MTRPPRSEEAIGVAYTGGAFLLWGLSPIFWKLLGTVPAPELLAHRIAWSAAIMMTLLGVRGGLGTAASHLRSRTALPSLLASTVLIAGNWLLYIWAVTNDRILEASLGYFVNPLVSVLLGLVVLGERLRRAQWLAVGLATVGVAVLVTRTGQLPLLSLALAGSFGLYGLLRKTVAASPEEGLTIETGLLAPAAIGFLIVRGDQGAFLRGDPVVDLLLVGTGVMTFLPLLWFAHGARRLPLSTVGLLQYLAPTLQFLLAVFAYDEPFDPSRGLAFVLIWTALVVYTVDARRRWRASRPRKATGAPPGGSGPSRS